MAIQDEIGEDYCNLSKILQKFKDELVNAVTKIDPTGKMLETSLSKNSAWLHYYDSRLNKLKILVNFFIIERDRVRGELYRQYKENYSRSLGERDILKYIDGEETYIKKKLILLEVEELAGEYEVIVECLKSQNYSLGHIAKLRIANLEYTEI